jgi:hypothetical protein
MNDKKPPTTPSDAAEARRAAELAAREARLAKALRDNLRRRKAPPAKGGDGG